LIAFCSANAAPVQLDLAGAKTVLGQILTGHIADGEGKPLPRAIVRVSRLGTLKGLASVPSDRHGTFAIKVPYGPMLVSASSKGFLQQAQVVSVQDDEALPGISFTLVRNGRGHGGRVLTPLGKPVPDGEIWVQDFPGFDQEKTFRAEIKDGNFELNIPPGIYLTKVKCPGYPIHADSAAFRQSKALTIRLLPPPTAVSPVVRAWVHRNAIPIATAEAGSGIGDLRALGSAVGSARIVGLGEATHGTHEFQTFKARMVEYLVSERGFTLLAIEEDYVKSLAVNDYVLNNAGDPERALANLDVNWWNTQEMLELVRWMRSWNADSSHPRKVSFVGTDIRSMAVPYARLMTDLAQVDPGRAARVKAKGLDDAFVRQTVERDKMAKEALAKGLTIIHELLAECDGLAWPTEPAARIKFNARLIQQFLTKYGSPNPYQVRDQVMADTVQFLLANEGPEARAILWAHNGHIGRSALFGFQSLGGHLRKALGKNYLPVALTFGHGLFRAYAHPMDQGLEQMVYEVAGASAASLDTAFTVPELAIMAIDLRGIPARGPVREWFREAHPMKGIGGGFNPLDPEFIMFEGGTQAAEAFDVFVHFTRTTPIRSNVSKWSTIDLPLGAARSVPSNLDFSCSDTGKPEFAWQLTSYESDESDLGWAPTVPATAAVSSLHDGSRTLVLKNFPKDANRIAVLAQNIDATIYREMAVTVSVFLQNGDPGKNLDARLWIRCTRSGGHPSTLSVKPKQLTGQNGWTRITLTARVPVDATEMAFGLSGLGKASLLVRNFQMEKR
jgi:erythromycin esterase